MRADSSANVTITVDPEFASLIPPLTEEEFAGLERSILEEGVREPIVTWRGVIVDGHNRYEIATAHGLEFDTVEYGFESRDDAKLWMIDNQCSRRNLPDIEKMILADMKRDILAEMGRRKQSEAGESHGRGMSDEIAFIKNDKSYETEPKVNTQAQLAKMAGVSSGKFAQFEQIKKHRPELIEEIRKGKETVGGAYKKVRKEQTRTEREERKSFELQEKFPEGMCSLYVSDIRDGLPEVADCSIDAIITDPPYPREYIGLYGDLAKVAARVLKPGGSLLAMAGQSYLPEVIAAMEGNGMEYHWCLSYLTPGGQAPHLFARNVNTFWKPVLWFVKGGYEGDCIGDVLKSDTNDNDKRFHHWGQSESGMSDIVERFTDPGQTVLDPFLGGGTTGVVALSMGRAFVGCELDPYTLDLAETRIRGAYGR